MQTQTELKTLSLKLTHLPSYANYILTHHLEAYVKLQWDLSLQNDLQIMRPFMELPKDEQNSLLQTSAAELLTSLTENKAAEHIQKGIENWTNNLLSICIGHL